MGKITPTCSQPAAHAAISRGSLLYTPPCAASTSVSNNSTYMVAPRRGTAVYRHPAGMFKRLQGVLTAAAAIMDAPDHSKNTAISLDPAVWLETDMETSNEPHAASNNTDSTSSKPHTRSTGQYLGVYEAQQSTAASNSSNDQLQPKSASSARPSSPQARSTSSHSKGPQPRGRPNKRAIRRLQSQYSSLFDQLEAEQTAMLHKHELEFMNLMYSGATQQELQQQQRRHDTMLHKLQSKYSQKWGPPVVRRSFLQASGRQQQQQQHHGTTSDGTEAADGIQQHQPGRHRQHPTAAAGCNSSSSSSKQYRNSSKPAGSSVFTIPDIPTESTTVAAADAQAAATVQRFTNQMVGAKIIADALSKNPVDIQTLDSLEIVFLHLALPKLVAWKLTPLMMKLTKYLLARPDRDQYTYGSIFNAYALANRCDLALSTWDELSTAGVDIGPYGSSALIKACARQRDVAAALQVFDQLLRRRVSFNAYTYNCLLQLCCSAGHIDDALAVYNLQRLETNPKSLPDAYSYNALMRGLLVSGRVELTQQLFENMLEDGVVADPRLYCNLLSAAGRAGNLGLARYLYQHMQLTLDLDNRQQQQQQQQQQRQAAVHDPRSSSGIQQASDPSVEEDVADEDDDDDVDDVDVQPNMLYILNALLFAHAQVGAYQGALAVYEQELVGKGLSPDAYTCTALLTAAARSSSASLSWQDVQLIVGIMRQYEISLTTQLGTALINAYRRVRVWQRPKPAAAGSSGSQRRRAGRQSDAGDGEGGSHGTDDDESVLAAVLQGQQQSDHELLAAAGAHALPNVQPAVAAALHAAQQMLQQLVDRKLATSNSYVTMLCFYLEQGQQASFKQLYAAMQQQGVQPDDQGWEKLLHAAEECGMHDSVLHLQEQQQMQQQRHLMQVRARSRGPRGQ